MDRAEAKEIYELHARICKAIADPKRLLIINALRSGRMSVTELCDSLEITQTNASQHLAILRERGVVTSERIGPNVYYSLRGNKVVRAVDLLREFMAETIGRQNTAIVPPRRGRARQAS